MWRRTYLLLLVIRVYFALSPSYLHPDENFQGPEVYAGTFKTQGRIRSEEHAQGFPQYKVPQRLRTAANLRFFLGRTIPHTSLEGAPHHLGLAFGSIVPSDLKMSNCLFRF